MKTLIIPDIHTKHLWAQAIIDQETFERAVLLGDYFDDFGDTPEANGATANWLLEKLDDARFTCLWGNHDQSYLSYNHSFICSGFTTAKAKIIRETMAHHYYKLKAAIEVEGWLLSHAGFSKDLIPAGRNPIEMAEEAIALQQDHITRVLGIGRVRGGWQEIGGFTWCDFNQEFISDPRWKQICGHTQGREVREKEGNFCIDTNRRHYGLIEDGNLIVKEF